MPTHAETSFKCVKEYGLAVGVTLLALVVRLLLDPYLGDHLPYVTFFVAVAVTAWYGGLGASLTAVLLGAVLSNWFFMPPRHTLALVGVKQQVGHLTYFLVTLAFVGLEQGLRQARRRVGVAMLNLESELIECKRAEEALRESEERLRLANLATNDAIWDWQIDTDTVVWNQGIETLFGWSQTACSPCTVAWWIERIHPDDRDRVADHFFKVSNDPTRTTWQEEYRFRKADGIYACVFDRGYALRSSDGKPSRMLGAMADVTQIKEAEAELRDRGNQLNVLYDLASAVNRADSLHAIYDKALDAILNTLRAERTSILLFDERGVMQFQAWRGLSETYRRAVAGHSPWKRGETGTMPIVVGDVAASDIDPALKTVILDEGIQAMAFVPLTSSGRIIGKFMVYFERSWTLDKEDLGVAQGIADLLGTGIERKRTEQALRESEQRLRAIMDYAPAAIFIKDPAGRYLFMNEQCARELSVNREQALGNTDRDLLSAELAEQFMANDQRVWESGSLLTVEEQVPHADGVHTSLVQKFLLRDNQGLPYALSGIALDITPHLRLESAIQASEARLQLAQSAANIGVFDWDIAAQKGVWSPELERIWGLPSGGFDGTAEAWQRLVHPDDLTSAHAGIRRSLEDSSTASEFEYRIVRPDGAVRWIYAKAKTLCDAEGRAVRMVGVNLDITDRKEGQLRLERFAEELEAQVEDRTRDLVQSQERLRALATDLNLAEQRERKRLATELHDHLQQMLVLGKLTIGQGKRLADGVPACEQIFKKVNDIFSDALTYTRTLVSDLSPTVLRDQGLAAALRWLGTYMHKHNLTVTVVVHLRDDLQLPEDRVILLFQSVRELLINSSKHAGTGEATVRMEQRDSHLWIEVRDEGVGFDLAAAAAAAAAETSIGGISSKFGLFSIRERMRALGGSFEMESAPNKGTTAMLVLPLRSSAECSVPGVDDVSLKTLGAHYLAPVRKHDVSYSSRRGPQDSVLSDRSSLGTQDASLQQDAKIRVLLVDDHAMVRQGLRAMLESYQDVQVVGEAVNGRDAVQLAEKLRPGIVVMDINMPKMDGIEATRQIKSRYPETTVIGLSVNAAKENVEAMKRAGAVGLMTKEAAVEQLYGVIQEAMKKGQ